MNKQQFLSLKRIKNLSKKEQNKRWEDHVRSANNVEKKVQRPKKFGLPDPSAECLGGYAACLADPFEAQPSCVPIFPSPISRKVKYFNRSSVYAGTNGVGYVLFSPSYGVTSSNSIITTGDDYTGDTTSTFATSGTGVNASSTNSPLSTASFGADSDEMKFRLVSAGIRIKWAGTNLNRGGSIRSLVSVNHESVTSHDSYSTLGKYVQTKISDVKDGWVTLTWTPIERSELDFTTIPGVTYNMVMAIHTPAVGTDAIFAYECFANYELIGQTVHGKTASYTSEHTESLLGNLNAPSWLSIENVAGAVAKYGPAVYHYYRQSLSNGGGSSIQLLE